MIKQIGTAARRAGAFFGARVYLDLHVKVKSEWRDDERCSTRWGCVRQSHESRGAGHETATRRISQQRVTGRSQDRSHQHDDGDPNDPRVTTSRPAVQDV